ncbi:hypothetical protein OX283_001270 [Flavobacterium sp. SUN052]|uniref:hypothetical protein n=1 Tax=Flavobacterium sp. SUN052 TaxID=3002441 RepID=UPI00237DD42B|nr:hypothetical protein [Flavobacterium sp. SUN052]MEC4003272.1 hypothetical protein [Flavobacterium sp. SUN052]
MEINTKLDPDKIDSYAKRIANGTIKIAGIIFGAIVLFFAFITNFSSITLIFLLVFGLLFAVMYAASINGARNMGKAIEIIISDNVVVISHSKKDMDGFTNFGMELNKAKYATKFDKVFPFSKIESTEIREKEILIKSSDFAFLDDNNVIRIPSECLKYEEIVEMIKNNSEKFKLVHGSI